MQFHFSPSRSAACLADGDDWVAVRRIAVEGLGISSPQQCHCVQSALGSKPKVQSLWLSGYRHGNPLPRSTSTTFHPASRVLKEQFSRLEGRILSINW